MGVVATSAEVSEGEGVPAPPTVTVIPGGGATAPSAGGPPSGGGAGTEPPAGILLAAFISAVGNSVAGAAQDLRARAAPAGAPGVELRGASLTIKAMITWERAGTVRLQPAKPGDPDSVVSQVVLTYEPVPRLTPSGKEKAP